MVAEINENLPLKDGYSTFGRVIKDLGIETPKGQRTHILRHSFASHFMMNGGDILKNLILAGMCQNKLRRKL